jgi:hypothetical protein
MTEKPPGGTNADRQHKAREVSGLIAVRWPVVTDVMRK